MKNYLQDKTEFKKELTELINKYSLENHCLLPDYIIADYLENCFNVLIDLTIDREGYFNNNSTIGN